MSDSADTQSADMSLSQNDKNENHPGQLKKVLGFTDVFAIGVGQVIGSGIMVLTGKAIGMTGQGIAYAFVIAAFFTIICTLPVAALGSAIPVTGGLYSYCKKLLGPKTGFFYLALVVSSHLLMAMFALGFADYLSALIPAMKTSAVTLGWFELSSIQLIAVLVFSTFYMTNMMGVKTVATIEKAMVLILLSGLFLFLYFGIPKVDFAAFTKIENVMPNGVKPFFLAVTLLSFATGGCKFISDLGGEMKNPSRDIPLTIVMATSLVGVFYFFIAVVASGILPIAQVAGENLSLVASEILPDTAYIFFMIGAGLFALATSLNAQFSWATKGVYVACQDGWLPNKFGDVNSKGAPKYILTLIFMIGLVTILSGKDIRFVALLGNGLSLIYDAIPVLAAVMLAKKYPELRAKAPFRIHQSIMYILCALAIFLMIAQAYLSFEDLKNVPIWIAIVVYFGLAIAYAHYRESHFKDSQAFDLK